MFNNRGGLNVNDSMSAGGGFLTSPGKSPMGGTQSDKKKVIQNMIPVTVAQVLKMPDGEEHLKIGSLAAHLISIVGKVVAVDEQTTKTTYKVDDMTGPPVEIHLWNGDNEDMNSGSRVPIMENMFVRILGNVRTLKGQRMVSAFRVQPITDMNDITMHMLEVVHTHMSITAMDKEPVEERMDTSSAFMGAPATGGNMFQGGATDNSLGLNKQQNLVYQAIFSVHTEDGISFDALCNQIKTLSKSTISELLKFLCNEGHIYTTIDDDHYKTIDSM